MIEVVGPYEVLDTVLTSGDEEPYQRASCKDDCHIVNKDCIFWLCMEHRLIV